MCCLYGSFDRTTPHTSKHDRQQQQPRTAVPVGTAVLTIASLASPGAHKRYRARIYLLSRYDSRRRRRPTYLCSELKRCCSKLVFGESTTKIAQQQQCLPVYLQYVPHDHRSLPRFPRSTSQALPCCPITSYLLNRYGGRPRPALSRGLSVLELKPCCRSTRLLIIWIMVWLHGPPGLPPMCMDCCRYCRPHLVPTAHTCLHLHTT